MRSILGFVLLVVLSGCATSYVEPESAAAVGSMVNHQESVGQIASKARKHFALSGFGITSDSGELIVTEKRFVRLSENDADCGSTFGLDYLRDKRTHTEVSYTLVNEPGSLTVVANIDGEYRPGSVAQDLTLTCKSKGTLERQLLDSIMN